MARHRLSLERRSARLALGLFAVLAIARPAEARRARYVQTAEERQQAIRVWAATADSTDPQIVFHGVGPADTAFATLARQLQKLARRANGPVGFAVHHIESGQGLSLRGGERFPMASVYKIPIALEVLHQASCDFIALEESLKIRPADLRTGSGWIWMRRRSVKALSIQELLEAMMIDSDNTASDLLMRRLGGPPVVMKRLAALGADGVRVDRYEAGMALDWAGVVEAPPDSTWTVHALWELKKDVPLDRRAESVMAFLADPRDTSTPNGMIDLLLKIWRHEALGPDDTSRLLEIMERCRTGPERIPRNLPPGTPVAHKTGTWSTAFGITAAVNDVGIVTLPEGRGHLAIAVFVKGARSSPRRIERTIAALAQAAYEQWAGKVPAAIEMPTGLRTDAPVTGAARPAGETFSTGAR